jgi:GntR family transcriptional regulator
MVDRDAGQAAYRQIASALRAEILSGALAPGAELPTEAQLAQRFQVNRTTIRRALDVLRAEGRIVSRRGAGSFVREQAVLRRLTSDLLVRSDRRGWYAALDAAGKPPAVKTSVSRVSLPPQMAPLLGLEPGAEVLARSRVMGVEGEPPIQLATSYIPLEVAERAPALQSLDTGPGGMLSRLEDAGYGPLHFDEVVSARAPSPEETSALQLNPGVPVLLVYRITYSRDDQVLDAMVRTIAADRCELAYRFGAEPEGSEG